MKLVFLFTLVECTYAVPSFHFLDCTPSSRRYGGPTIDEDFPHVNNNFFPRLKFAAMDGDAEKLYDILSTINGTSTINDTDHEGMTALHWASMVGKTEAVKVLLCFGADVLQVDNNKNTALHYAALSGNPHLIRWLVPLGGNVNAKNADEETPLHLATEKGFFYVVMTLIEYGADTLIRDRKRTLLLDLAISKGNQSIIKLLKSIGNREETDELLYQWMDEGRIINPVVGGSDAYCDEVYVGRIHYNDETLPAKVCPKASLAYFTSNDTEWSYKSYEILDSINIAWKPFQENDTIPREAIVGGMSKSGETYYIGRAKVISDGRPFITPGKVPVGDKRLYTPFGYKEHTFTKYEILVLHL